MNYLILPILILCYGCDSWLPSRLNRLESKVALLECHLDPIPIVDGVIFYLGHNPATLRFVNNSWLILSPDGSVMSIGMSGMSENELRRKLHDLKATKNLCK